MPKSYSKPTSNMTCELTYGNQIGIKFNPTKSVPPFIILICYLQWFALTALGYIMGDSSQQVRCCSIKRIPLFSAKRNTIDENGHLLLTIPNPNYISLNENPQIGQFFVFFEEVKT